MQLHLELRKARIIDPEAVDASHVSIGTRVRLEPVQGGEPRFAAILGPWDSNPDGGVFSYLSDFAKGLLKRTLGEIVTIDGREYRIAEIQACLKEPESSPVSEEGRSRAAFLTAAATGVERPLVVFWPSLAGGAVGMLVLLCYG